MFEACTARSAASAPGRPGAGPPGVQDGPVSRYALLSAQGRPRIPRWRAVCPARPRRHLARPQPFELLEQALAAPRAMELPWSYEATDGISSIWASRPASRQSKRASCRHLRYGVAAEAWRYSGVRRNVVLYGANRSAATKLVALEARRGASATGPRWLERQWAIGERHARVHPLQPHSLRIASLWVPGSCSMMTVRSEHAPWRWF